MPTIQALPFAPRSRCGLPPQAQPSSKPARRDPLRRGDHRTPAAHRVADDAAPKLRVGVAGTATGSRAARIAAAAAAGERRPPTRVALRTRAAPLATTLPAAVAPLEPLAAREAGPGPHGRMSATVDALGFVCVLAAFVVAALLL